MTKIINYTYKFRIKPTKNENPIYVFNVNDNNLTFYNSIIKGKEAMLEGDTTIESYSGVQAEVKLEKIVII